MTTTKPIDANQEAIRIKAKLDKEAAERYEKSKRNMNLGDTLKLTGKTKPGWVYKGLKAVFFVRDDDK